MTERISFIPGACTAEAKEIFEAVDAGEYNETAIRAAQQACHTCVQLNACSKQAHIVRFELQKSDIKDTVVATDYANGPPVPEHIRNSAAMLKDPVIVWEKQPLPDDPVHALSILRIARRAGQFSTRRDFWVARSAGTAPLKEKLAMTAQRNGLGPEIATRAISSLVLTYAEHIALQAGVPFTPPQEMQLRDISSVFIEEVKKLQDLSFSAPDRIALFHSAAYCERLWEFYHSRYNITPGNFRNKLQQSIVDPVQGIEGYIASHPSAQKAPRKQWQLSDNHLAYPHFRRNAKVDRTEEAITQARKDLQIYHNHPDFTPTFIDALASSGDHALGRARAYLERLAAIRTVAEEHNIDMSPAVQRATASHYSQAIVDPGELEIIAANNRLRSRYRPDAYLQPWMVRRMVETQAPAERTISIERLRYLIRRGYVMETDYSEVQQRSWHCADLDASRSLISTPKLEKLSGQERLCLMHTLGLGSFFGESPISPENMAEQQGIHNPAELGWLLVPHIDQPTGRDQTAQTTLARLRYNIFNHVNVGQEVASLDPTYLASICQLVKHSRRKPPKLASRLDSPALQQGVSIALACSGFRPSQKEETLRKHAQSIRIYLEETAQLTALGAPEEESHIHALCYGLAYFKRLKAYGSPRITAWILAQSYDVLGLRRPVRAARPQRLHVDIPPVAQPKPSVPTAKPVVKLPEARRPAAPAAQEPSQQVSQIAPLAPPTAEKPQTYSSVEQLPDPERAAVYIAHSAMGRFTFEMRQRGWHDLQKVLKHFGVKDRGELINHVRTTILPRVQRSSGPPAHKPKGTR